jgi:hypothetical protein
MAKKNISKHLTPPSPLHSSFPLNGIFEFFEKNIHPHSTYIPKKCLPFCQTIHENIQILNNSKIFAGIIIIVLNIAGKFVNFKLSKSIESYLTHTFSRNILVFCIVWMGSREIYVALFITLVFVFVMDVLFNENSKYCVLPETFTTYHASLNEDKPPTNEQIKQAENVLERAKKMSK